MPFFSDKYIRNETELERHTLPSAKNLKCQKLKDIVDK